MDSLIRANSNESSSTIDTFVITLIPCDYDSSDEYEKSLNVSKFSISFSDISDNSDGFEIVKNTEIIKSEKKHDIMKEDKNRSNEINIAQNKKM